MQGLNSAKVQEVFRKHHITATGVDAVREGYEKKGSFFLYEFMKAFSGKTSTLNSYSDGDSQLDAGGDSGYTMGPPTYEQWLADQQKKDPTGKKTWADILKLIAQTGETIAGVKNNILGAPEPDPTAPDPKVTKKNAVYIYVAAGILVLVVGFLIFKQSKS